MTASVKPRSRATLVRGLTWISRKSFKDRNSVLYRGDRNYWKHIHGLSLLCLHHSSKVHLVLHLLKDNSFMKTWWQKDSAISRDSSHQIKWYTHHNLIDPRQLFRLFSKKRSLKIVKFKMPWTGPLEAQTKNTLTSIRTQRLKGPLLKFGFWTDIKLSKLSEDLYLYNN